MPAGPSSKMNGALSKHDYITEGVVCIYSLEGSPACLAGSVGLQVFEKYLLTMTSMCPWFKHYLHRSSCTALSGEKEFSNTG